MERKTVTLSEDRYKELLKKESQLANLKRRLKDTIDSKEIPDTDVEI